MLVTFTGYACTNCHWMKANMFPRPEIADVVKDLILVELYTDGTDEAPKQNQELQEKSFRHRRHPLLRAHGPDGKVVATFPGLTPQSPGIIWLF